MPGAFARPVEDDSAVDLRLALYVDGAWDFAWAKAGHSQYARRLRVDAVSAGLNEYPPRAELSVNTAGEYDEDGSVIDEPLELGDLADIVHPDIRACLYGELPDTVPGGGAASRRFLMEGYIKNHHPSWSEEHLDGRLIMTSLLERLATERVCQVHGRRMLNGRVLAEMRHITADLCVFNEGGKPNRLAELQTVEGVSCPVFTWNDAPGAEYWRWGDILTYLLAVHFKKLGPNYPLQDGNGIALCENAVASEGVTEIAAGFTFGDLMRSKAEEFTCDNMTLPEALLLWCKATGCCMSCVTRTVSNLPETVLLFWLAGDGGPFEASTSGEDLEHRAIRTDETRPAFGARAMRLQVPGAASSYPSAALAANEATAGDIMIDDSGLITKCRQTGAVERYEVTAGVAINTSPVGRFMPAWAPDSTFGDNLSGSSLDAKALRIRELETVTDSADLSIEAATLFDRYTSGGADHAAYANVGRVWALNEDGRLDGDTYARTNGTPAFNFNPWSSSNYNNPFNWHTSCEVPHYDGDSWVVKPRRMLKPLSLLTSGTLQAPIIHASWDQGQTFYRYPGNVEIDEASCTVKLTDANLATVMDPSGAEWSVWEAIAKGYFRLAATFSVEGDGRVVSEADADAPFATAEHLRWGHNYQSYRYRARANSVLEGVPAWGFSEVDDSDRIGDLARRMVLNGQGRLVSGTIVTPWLRHDWWPGDLCSGVQPRGLDFAATVGGEPRYPQAVLVQWVNREGSGQSTQVVLGDARVAMSRYRGSGRRRK